MCHKNSDLARVPGLPAAAHQWQQSYWLSQRGGCIQQSIQIEAIGQSPELIFALPSSSHPPTNAGTTQKSVSEFVFMIKTRYTRVWFQSLYIRDEISFDKYRRQTRSADPCRGDDA